MSRRQMLSTGALVALLSASAAAQDAWAVIAAASKAMGADNLTRVMK